MAAGAGDTLGKTTAATAKTQLSWWSLCLIWGDGQWPDVSTGKQKMGSRVRCCAGRWIGAGVERAWSVGVDEAMWRSLQEAGIGQGLGWPLGISEKHMPGGEKKKSRDAGENTLVSHVWGTVGDGYRGNLPKCLTDSNFWLVNFNYC